MDWMALYRRRDGAIVRTITCLFIAVVSLSAQTVDQYGVVVTGRNAAFNKILGPQIPIGASPWTYGDIMEPQINASIIPAAIANAPVLGTAFSGTCAYTDGRSSCVGTGSNYVAEMVPYQCVVIAWDTIDGVGTGRRTDSVYQITDATHVNFTNFESDIPATNPVTIYRCPAETSTFIGVTWNFYGSGGSFGWNYYDTGAATYRMHFRTAALNAGSTYLNNARAFEDVWWQWGVDHGSWMGSPRADSYMGVFLRALDGHPERLDPIYNMMQLTIRTGNTSFDPRVYSRLVVMDTRERGYIQSFLAMGAVADTAANGGSDAHHTSYCATLIERTPGWFTTTANGGLLDPKGFWDEPIFQWNTGYPNSGTTNSPWRLNIPIKGLMQTYELLADTNPLTGCNSPAMAATLLPIIKAAVDWTWDYGVSQLSSGGSGYGYYQVNSPSSGLGGVPKTGTLAMTLGSAAVVGTATTFTTDFNCNGTDYIYSTDPLTFHYKSIYKVTACADNTHLTIADTFGTYSEPSAVTVATYGRTPGNSTTCDNLSTYCESGGGVVIPPDGDPNQSRDMVYSQGWMWLYTGDPKYKDRGDRLTAQWMRGPGDGAYGSAPCNGPYCISGYPGATDKDDWALSLPTPCGNGCGAGVYGYNAFGKRYGQGSGFLCGQCFLAMRLQPAIIVTVKPTWMLL